MKSRHFGGDDLGTIGNDVNRFGNDVKRFGNDVVTIWRIAANFHELSPPDNRTFFVQKRAWPKVHFLRRFFQKQGQCTPRELLKFDEIATLRR